MYNYIPHPSNHGKSSMVTALLIEEGHAAYGIYWLVLELLRDCPGYKIGNNYKAIAWSIHCTDINLVDRVLHNYGLFDLDGNGLLFSPWLNDQMQAYDARKKKLQEAGRRGAAKRFATPSMEDGQAIATPSMEDGQAIATPSMEDGQAIAYNITQHNITQPNVMLSDASYAQEWRDVCRNQGDRISDELLQALSTTSPEGHVPAYIAQICRQYGMGENVLNLLCELTNNADITSGTYKKFVAIVKRIEVEKFHPKLPANYILSKLQSNQ